MRPWGSCPVLNRMDARLHRRITSSAINQNAERSRNGRPLRMRPLRSGSRGRSKIRCVHKEVVCFGVQPHGLGPELGLDGLDLAEFVRRVLVEYMDHTLARRGEEQPSFGLIGGGIHTR